MDFRRFLTYGLPLMRTSPVIFIRLVSSRKESTERNVVFPLPVIEKIVLIVEVSFEVSGH
jgi:hypothetical protein